MDFKFDLFGDGPKDVSRQSVIKDWVRAHFALGVDVPVLVTEIYCDQPGCAPVETLIAILDPGGRRQFKMGRPLREVVKEDIRHMQPNPDGHGPRIDVDKLGSGKWE